MSTIERRVARWSEVVGDLVLQDLTEFPRLVVAQAIADDFDSDAAWSWMDGDDFGFELRQPAPGWPDPGALDFWQRVGLDFHPLIRWFAATGQASPMSTGRVPRTIAPEACFAALRACMAPIGFDQQLSIPYVLAPGRHRAFVLAQAGEDYSDEDLEVARRLQPLLMLLERQVRARGSLDVPGRRGEDAGLTGREHAVLALVAEGRTAEAIGRELRISPRTVHKHLENLYRKLGVSDRLRAVVVARQAGLLVGVGQQSPGLAVPPPPCRTGADAERGRWSGRARQRFVHQITGLSPA